MRRFIQRALDKVPRMTSEQIRSLIDTLIEENSRLESVLDSMTDGLLVLDIDHSLLLANKAAERLLPIQGGDTGSRPVWQFLEDEEIALFVRKSLEGFDRIQDRDFTLEMPGSQLRTLALSIMPLVRAGKIHGSLIHIEDVSEKRSREARLRRAESLASLTTLSAGVAHEIKNPLASISIHIQLVKRALKDNHAACASISHYMEVLDEEVERLNRITVDFLFAVRPLDVQLTEGDLNSFVLKLAEFMHFELEQAGIKLRLNLAKNLPPLMLDERLLKQAMLNLVKNAIAAMSSGGRLRICTEREADWVRLWIADNGEGIAEANLSKIFEPYFSTRSDGSGLGLTLVYKIFKAHSADIQVSSKPGRGTRFDILFPVPVKQRNLLEYGDGQ